MYVRDIELSKGGNIMEVSYNKLKGLMAEKGFTIRSLSKNTGIPVSTLSNKLNGLTEFKTSEILKISYILGISDVTEYFLLQKFEIQNGLQNKMYIFLNSFLALPS